MPVLSLSQRFAGEQSRAARELEWAFFSEPGEVPSMFTVRPATPADAPLIAAFNRAMAHETEARQLASEVIEAGVRAVFADAARGFYLVADGAAGPIACLMVTYEWSDWRNGNFWWIQSVYVQPQARRRGVFAALYGHVEQAARAAGACGLRLYVEDANRGAMASYASLGMRDAHYRVMEQCFE